MKRSSGFIFFNCFNLLTTVGAISYFLYEHAPFHPGGFIDQKDPVFLPPEACPINVRDVHVHYFSQYGWLRFFDLGNILFLVLRKYAWITISPGSGEGDLETCCGASDGVFMWMAQQFIHIVYIFLVFARLSYCQRGFPILDGRLLRGELHAADMSFWRFIYHWECELSVPFGQGYKTIGVAKNHAIVKCFRNAI